METILLILLGLCFSFGYLLEKLTDFIKQLKTSGSATLHKGFKAELSVIPTEQKKRSLCRKHKLQK